MSEKKFELTHAYRDGNNQLKFRMEVVNAKDKAEANRIGKRQHNPEDRNWFRSDLTRQI